MNPKEKIPREIIVPVVAGIVLHSIARNFDLNNRSQGEAQGKRAVEVAFNMADAFAEQLKQRGLLE